MDEGCTAPQSLTRPPQLLALVPVGEAHAIVAVGLAALAESTVHLVEVGGAEGRLARAELGKVTLLGLITAQGARSHQLGRGTRGENTVHDLSVLDLTRIIVQNGTFTTVTS